MKEPFKKWTKAEVLAKVEWEGGIVPALMWGLRAEDIEDDDLAAEWARVQAVLPAIEAIWKLLPDSVEDVDD